MAARALTVLLLSAAAALRLAPADPHPPCPEPCECGRATPPQPLLHVLCANRGLRAVPSALPVESARLVRVLSLAGNFISDVGARDLAHYRRLASLNLQFNRIGRVHPRAFARLHELRELYLGHNLLAALTPRMLRPLTQLSVLYINNNIIEELEPGAFGSLEHVTRLRLESNRLLRVYPATFANLTRLHFLNLSDNLQTELRDSSVFAGLAALRTLLLARNRIVHVSTGIFRDLESLETLSLSGNGIIQIESHALEGLSNLRELALDRNALTEVPAELLDPLVHLENLDLGGNQIVHVHEDAFKNLARLRVLTLRQNRLTRLEGGTLAGNTGLRTLDLRGNEWRCGCQVEALRSQVGGGGKDGGETEVQCYDGKLEEQVEEVEPEEWCTAAAGAPEKEVMEEVVVKEEVFAKEVKEVLDEEVLEEVVVKEEVVEEVLEERGKASALKGTLATNTVPLATEDACLFNRHHIDNVTADDITDTTATVRWSAQGWGNKLSLHFRVFFDRLGSSTRFPRYAHADGTNRELTLRELRPNSAYMACVESIVGGASCHMASREHCTGFVTGTDGGGAQEVGAWHMATAALAVSVLLVVLLGGAGLVHTFKKRRRTRSNRMKGGGRGYSYSARTPFRSAMVTACASSEFSAYRSGRSLAEDGDLIQFTGERLYSAPLGSREGDATVPRFSD
ncbi:TLR4 interactor with leucine rich repeats [Astyanax mexicanus]|uniref:TLR4 interactor with leucine rich repeats n=1 Tax=Astyanax mexicanus TaxID=7994 RepID=UPI0020CB3C2A|nr:TLR4 interactor with leucine rich repeats [Astyanax mexicanus]